MELIYEIGAKPNNRLKLTAALFPTVALQLSPRVAPTKKSTLPSCANFQMRTRLA
jgi:hypothetical protein